MSRYVCKLHVSGDKQYKPGDEIELDDVEAGELVRLGYLETEPVETPAKAKK